MMRSFTREEKFGFAVTAGTHLMMLLLAWFMVTEPKERDRLAFIEVTLGEFQDGTLAEFAPEEEAQPETSPEPFETVAEEPDPEEIPQPEPEQVPQPEAEEPARDVELPEQEEEIDSEVVTTPDTDRVDLTEIGEEKEEIEEPAAPSTAQQDEVEQEGEEERGDIRGIRGRVDVDQGTGTDPIRSGPYQLEWEGDITRAPIVQPLPEYVAETEAVISVRFEVRPDGTVGSLRPIIRGNPELDREVLRTLRTWRFSRLPSHLPQESQYGTITFRFVLE